MHQCRGIVTICVRWRLSQIYVYYIPQDNLCWGREMQFFEGSVERKIPLSGGVQQSEHRGAAGACRRMWAAWHIQFLTSHWMAASSSKAPGRQTPCLCDGESNTATKRPQEENMKLGERKKRELQKGINWNKFLPWFSSKGLHFLETCSRMFLDSSNIFYSPLISLLFIPF